MFRIHPRALPRPRPRLESGHSLGASNPEVGVAGGVGGRSAASLRGFHVKARLDLGVGCGVSGSPSSWSVRWFHRFRPSGRLVQRRSGLSLVDNGHLSSYSFNSHMIVLIGVVTNNAAPAGSIWNISTCRNVLRPSRLCTCLPPGHIASSHPWAHLGSSSSAWNIRANTALALNCRVRPDSTLQLYLWAREREESEGADVCT